MNPWMNARRMAISAAWLMWWSSASLAQTSSPVVLELDLDNDVQYFQDVDWTKLSSLPGLTPPTTGGPRSFGGVIGIADIVAINGKPVKGTYMIQGSPVLLRTAPNPGQAIADVVRNGPGFETFEILQADGTPIGSIMSAGLVNGPAPPGSPAVLTLSNSAIVGGTGAFLGAKGQCSGGVKPLGAPIRSASASEDPANRRTNGGGKVRAIISLIPMSRPNIIATPSGGPAVVHSSDFSPVTGANPAKRGEILSVFATGLGPVRPAVDAGQPFPASPLAFVNSPVDVIVNGASAEVIGAVGYPGSADSYQVNFRVPTDGTPGVGTMQLSAAWIPSNAVQITIQ